MADITMCMNKDCPLAKSCYRKTATIGMRQSMSDFKYEIVDGNVECDHYWGTKQKSTLKDEN